MQSKSDWSLAGVMIASLLSGCATAPEHATSGTPASVELGFVNRLTWGVAPTDYQLAEHLGREAYLDAQLHPTQARLPEAIESQISAMRISQTPLDALVLELEAHRRAADAIKDDDEKKAAQQAYQQELQGVAREAATRSIARDLYASDQLREQMTWFWMNHFNVNQNKANLRAMIGDFEEHAIRPHVFGHFKDLVHATLLHPAMVRYLDNEQNAVNHVNENYARELMELHTLGVNGGYSQHDVQELARILTGLGLDLNPTAAVPAKGTAPPVRFGLTEFSPARHDFGDKNFLGHTIKGRGLAEIDEAVNLICQQPATAHFVTRKIAMYFVADEPPPALLERMAHTFMTTDGDIAAVLHTMFDAPEFSASLEHKFKDPMHFVLSEVRLAYGARPILNVQPILGWLSQMGEPWSAHETPDGYPLVASAWDSPGQMTTRFEIARAIGSSSQGLFKPFGDTRAPEPAFPQPITAFFYAVIDPSLGAPTRQALAQATSAQEWNTFLFSSPELSQR